MPAGGSQKCEDSVAGNGPAPGPSMSTRPAVARCPGRARCRRPCSTEWHGAAEPDPEEPAHGAASAVAPDQIARPQHLGSVNRDSLVVLLEAGQPPVPAQLAAEFGKAALQDLLDARLQDSHLIRVPGVECGVVQGDTREVASFDPADRLLVRVRQQPAQREQLGGGRLQALQEPLKSACDCSAAAGRAEATPSARFAPAAVRS